MGYAEECFGAEFGLDRVLDFGVCFEVYGGSVSGVSMMWRTERGEGTDVASSRTITLLSFTSARAKLRRDRSPTLYPVNYSVCPKLKIGYSPQIRPFLVNNCIQRKSVSGLSIRRLDWCRISRCLLFRYQIRSSESRP